MSDFESDIERDDEFVSKQIRDAAKVVSLNLFPEKSKKLYTAAYNEFKKWCRVKGTNSFCEDVLLVYFTELSKRYAPTSLWAIFSMLKCTINTFNKINIGKYAKLIAFLKKEKAGYFPTKAATLTKENITKFLSEAADETHLCEKVVLIFGIAGALKRCEFVNLELKHVSKIENEDQLKISIDKTKNNVNRCFTVEGVFYEVCSKYMKLRPKDCMTDRFFIRYNDGKCFGQPMGINKFGSIPKDIAEWLSLPNLREFSGHSPRRTSATLLVEAGADLATLMLHGGWKSSTVALGYVGESLNKKKRIFETITTGIEVDNLNVKKALHEPRNYEKSIQNEQISLIKSNYNTVSPTSKSVSLSKNHQSLDVVKQAEIEHNSIRIMSEKIIDPNVDLVNTNERNKSFVSEATSSTMNSIKQQGGSNQFAYLSPQGLKSNVNVSYNSTNSSVHNHSIAYKRKLSVAYHPDFGLYVPDIHDNNIEEFIVFNNCNVTIIQEKCSAVDVSCQTDE